MVHNPLSRLGRRDDGAIAILTVLLTSAVFIGLCALVVDTGSARDNRRQAQNAADASALAAGNVLYAGGAVNITAGSNLAGGTSAISAAKSYAAINFGVTQADWAACTDASALSIHPDTVCISFDSSTQPTTVRVKVPIRNVSTPFAQVWKTTPGSATVPVDASAMIQVQPGGLARCGLCVIGSGTHSLQNGHITVSGGANIAINGTLSAGPQGSITATGGGTISLQGAADGTLTPAALTNQPAVADPLGSLAMPDFTTLSNRATANACPGTPGIYDHLIACANMTAGLYALTGTTGGNFDITGTGVTLYFICGTPTTPRACTAADPTHAGLSFNGNGSLNITAPTIPPYKGLAMISDRGAKVTLDFGGNGTYSSSGTIYVPSGTMHYNGNGNGNPINSLIVVGDFDFNGNPSAFLSAYTQSANVTISATNLHLSQ